MSELTLFLLRIVFLALLWFFVFGIVYALRSDLFGQRVRKLPAGQQPAATGEDQRRQGEPEQEGDPAVRKARQGVQDGQKQPCQGGGSQDAHRGLYSLPSAVLCGYAPEGQGKPGQDDAGDEQEIAGDGPQLAPGAAKRLAGFEAAGYADLPVCIAKTQYSFSADPAAMGAPEGQILPVREVRLLAGAGFVVAECGVVMTMPGLPRTPADAGMRLDAEGRIDGLF